MKSWIQGQTRLDDFFSGSSTRSQPIIDVDAASDIESDTIELIDSEAALDQPSTWGYRSLSPEIRPFVDVLNIDR